MVQNSKQNDVQQELTALVDHALPQEIVIDELIEGFATANPITSRDVHLGIAGAILQMNSHNMELVSCSLRMQLPMISPLYLKPEICGKKETVGGIMSWVPSSLSQVYPFVLEIRFDLQTAYVGPQETALWS